MLLTFFAPQVPYLLNGWGLIIGLAMRINEGRAAKSSGQCEDIISSIYLLFFKGT
jgi:hypothetical protein